MVIEEFYQELVGGERISSDELRRRQRRGGAEHADQRLPLVSPERVADEHHRLPPHSPQEIHPVEPKQISHIIR